jgi:hypothetical protein
MGLNKGSDWGGSAIQTFQKCKTKYKNRYLEEHPDGGQGLEGKLDSYAASLGTVLHAGLHEFYKTVINKDPRPYDERAAAAMLAAVNQIHTLTLLNGQDKLMYEEVVSYLDQYFQFYTNDEELEVQAAEVPFEVKVGAYTFTGTIDIIGAWKGHECVPDHKTTSKPWDKLFREHYYSLSLRGYAYSRWKKTGIIPYLLVNGIRRLKDKAMTAEFRREPIVLTEDDMDEFERTVLYEREAMDKCAAEGYWPKSAEACVSVYGICEYDALCRFPDASTVVTLYRPRRSNVSPEE